ncbi:MAG: peptide chain release factor 1 [Candidatus Omnitrophica bacterium]|nr:peptide chain release factor 1 [Candidatus Omnitrophota bacterium]
MLKLLENKKKRFEELKTLLSDDKVISDRPLYQKYAKELSSMSQLLEKYDAYMRYEDEKSGLEAMLREKHESDFIELAKLEIAHIEAKQSGVMFELEGMLIEDDPDASRNIIMEIRAGTGGLEASLFVSDLFRMYTKYAQANRWKVDVMNTSPSEAGGLKEVIFSVEGHDIFKRLKYESGTHRVQRVPSTEAQGRIHTSAVTVAVLPEAEEVDIKIEPKDLRIDVYRSSGCGGQSVNTTDSAVRITHIPTNVIVSCQDERSQLKNKVKAMKILRSRLFEKFRQDQADKITMQRRTQVGTGDRSQKIRTYNFPDRRVTDHRIGLTIHKLEAVLEGDLDDLINALIESDRKKKLENL